MSSADLGARVLIVGLPRSGTTWIAQMLASGEDTALVSEPDNPNDVPFALRKRKLPGGYYTALAPGEAAPAYERLWRAAFGELPEPGGMTGALRRRVARKLFRPAKAAVRDAFTTRPRMPAALRAAEALAVPMRPGACRNVVVKTVYAARSLEWIAGQVDARVLVVRRDLRSVLSSWIELWGVGAGPDNELETADPEGLQLATSALGLPAPPGDPLERTAWLLGVLDLLMVRAAAHRPDWVVVRYEDLLDDPAAAFRSLARQLDLPWGATSDELVRATDRPGTGFVTQRVAAEARDVWRSRLSADQQRSISSVLAALDISGP